MMAKPKRKLTPQEKANKKRRQLEYMTIFINGKQKRVKRPPTIDSMDVDEFIELNADPIWLMQNEEWEILHALYVNDMENNSLGENLSLECYRDIYLTEKEKR